MDTYSGLSDWYRSFLQQVGLDGHSQRAFVDLAAFAVDGNCLKAYPCCSGKALEDHHRTYYSLLRRELVFCTTGRPSPWDRFKGVPVAVTLESKRQPWPFLRLSFDEK